MLVKIGDITSKFGISHRSLRYWEDIGIIKSSRAENDYRYYDEENQQKIRQILILRKLRLSLKQIIMVLQSDNTVEIIDTLQKNLTEVENEINALSTIRSILDSFITKLNENIIIDIKVNLLDDSTILEIADSLIITRPALKEEKTSEDLVNADETLNKLKEKFVRVVKLPPATMAHLFCKVDKINPDNPAEVYDIAMNIMGEFIKDTDLLRIKPDFRYFQGGNAELTTCEIRVTIPDDLEVPAPLRKINYQGGLYAAYTNTPDDNVSWKIVEAWAENSDDYEWRAGEARFEEHLNKFNIYGLKNADFEYWDFLLPIKEIEKITEEQIDKLNTAEELISQHKPTEITLTEMVKHGEADLEFKNGLMELKVDGEHNGMVTSQQFKSPLKIAFRLKTDGKDFRIRYAKGEIVFNWEHIRSTMLISDISNGKYYFFKKRGIIRADEFVDIEWILGTDVMAVKVNGEIRHVGSDFGYIKTLIENPEFNLLSAVTIVTSFGSTLTVERLCITEI